MPAPRKETSSLAGVVRARQRAQLGEQLDLATEPPAGPAAVQTDAGGDLGEEVVHRAGGADGREHLAQVFGGMRYVVRGSLLSVTRPRTCPLSQRSLPRAGQACSRKAL